MVLTVPKNTSAPGTAFDTDMPHVDCLESVESQSSSARFSRSGGGTPTLLQEKNVTCISYSYK